MVRVQVVLRRVLVDVVRVVGSVVLLFGALVVLLLLLVLQQVLQLLQLLIRLRVWVVLGVVLMLRVHEMRPRPMRRWRRVILAVLRIHFLVKRWLPSTACAMTSNTAVAAASTLLAGPQLGGGGVRGIQ